MGLTNTDHGTADEKANKFVWLVSQSQLQLTLVDQWECLHFVAPNLSAFLVHFHDRDLHYCEETQLAVSTIVCSAHNSSYLADGVSSPSCLPSNHVHEYVLTKTLLTKFLLCVGRHSCNVLTDWQVYDLHFIAHFLSSKFFFGRLVWEVIICSLTAFLFNLFLHKISC